MSATRRPIQERFGEKVNKTEGCWLWTASTNKTGYGQISTERGHRPLAAHRVSWELANGPIPDGLWVLHCCDIPPCVRPDHLYLGTVRENTNDMLERGGHWTARHPVEVRALGDRNGARKHPEKYVRLVTPELRQVIADASTAERGWANALALRLGISLQNVHRWHRIYTKAQGAPTRRSRGELNGIAKLTEESVREIRSLYSSGKLNQYQLAAQFGMARTQIGNIVNRRQWQHVE